MCGKRWSKRRDRAADRGPTAGQSSEMTTKPCTHSSPLSLRPSARDAGEPSSYNEFPLPWPWPRNCCHRVHKPSLYTWTNCVWTTRTGVSEGDGRCKTSDLDGVVELRRPRRTTEEDLLATTFVLWILYIWYTQCSSGFMFLYDCTALTAPHVEQTLSATALLRLSSSSDHLDRMSRNRNWIDDSNRIDHWLTIQMMVFSNGLMIVFISEWSFLTNYLDFFFTFNMW